MRTFKNVCAQGDIYIRRVDALPANAVFVDPKTTSTQHVENGKYVVTHSESGHHHVMEAREAKMYTIPDSIMDIFLEVEDNATLEHFRPHDTHETIGFTKGIYHVRRQREYVPEGYRRVED
jgi:hypothetical protein